MVLGMEKGDYILTALLEKSKLMLIWSYCIITNQLFPNDVTLQSRETWAPPLEGWVMVNVDAAVFANQTKRALV
jgi:hypothetical protein